MIARIWMAVFRALLWLYPRSFRVRFGEEMLDHARRRMAATSPPAGWKAGLLLVADAWDLVTCAGKAHFHASKRPVVLLASASGGQAGCAQKPGLDWPWLRRTLPPVILGAAALLVGGLFVGLGIYDYGQYWLYGVLGLGLIVVAGACLYRKLEDYEGFVAQYPDDQSRRASATVMLLSVALVFVLITIGGIEFVSGFSRLLQAQGGPVSADDYLGVVGIPAIVPVILVAAAFVLMIGGLTMLTSSQKGYAICCILLLGLLGAFAKEMGLPGWGWTVACVAAAMAAFGLFARLGHAARWLRRVGLVLVLTAHPLLLGFLCGLVFDLGFTQAQQQTYGAGASNVQSPTLMDQASQYAVALDRVRAGEDPQLFWKTVETIDHQRAAWGRHKPWSWAVRLTPVGISALRWCQATARGDALFQCSFMSDPEAWVTAPPNPGPRSR